MTDAALIAASLQGDRAAFGSIVERYQAMACAVAYSLVGDIAASEDVAQEAFIAAWKQLASLRQPDRLRSWLAGIVRNMANNTARKRQRDVAHQALPIELVGDAIPTPYESVERQEEETLLSRALTEVPEQFREPLVLFYREHQSIAEVAMTMNISEDAVKQRLARGRQALKDQVAVFVEAALKRTGPTAAFTAGVLTALNTSAGSATAATAATGGVAAAAGGLGSGAMAGIIGGVGGSLLGIAGGAFGTACSIRNTRTPAERALMVKAAWFAWIYSIVFVGIMLYAAFWQRSWFESVWFQVTFWTIHALVLGISIPLVNRKAARLRQSGE